MGFLHTVMDTEQFTGPIITALIVGNSLWYLGGFWFLGIVLIVAAAVFSWTFRPRAR